MGGSRSRPLGRSLVEVYRTCPKCKTEHRVRLTTAEVEDQRRALSYWMARLDKARSYNRDSAYLRSLVESNRAILISMATRAGIQEHVRDLCP